MLTYEEAITRIFYEPKSGKFYWKSAQKSERVGCETGFIGKDGRLRIEISGKKYSAGRLAYLLMTGSFPEGKLEIDHINRNPSDNRWCNLRLASRSMNAANRGPFVNTLSGVKGVRFDKQKGKWHAYIRHLGKNHHLGFFDLKEDAIKVRREQEINIFGQFSPLQSDKNG